MIGPDGVATNRPGNVGPPVDPIVTTRVAEWNDLASVERELAPGDVAAILAEPALTNIGIVLAGARLPGRRCVTSRPARHAADDRRDAHHLRRSWRHDRARRTRPDIFVIGKSLAGGVPCGAYGLTESIAAAVTDARGDGSADLVDVGGVGGTLAGSALSLAAMRAHPGEVLTDAAFERHDRPRHRYATDVRQTIEEHRVPWSIAQLGARAEYRFVTRAAQRWRVAAAAADDELDEFMHLYTSTAAS